MPARSRRRPRSRPDPTASRGSPAPRRTARRSSPPAPGSGRSRCASLARSRRSPRSGRPCRAPRPAEQPELAHDRLRHLREGHPGQRRLAVAQHSQQQWTRGSPRRYSKTSAASAEQSPGPEFHKRQAQGTIGLPERQFPANPTRGGPNYHLAASASNGLLRACNATVNDAGDHVGPPGTHGEKRLYLRQERIARLFDEGGQLPVPLFADESVPRLGGERREELSHGMELDVIEQENATLSQTRVAKAKVDENCWPPVAAHLRGQDRRYVLPRIVWGERTSDRFSIIASGVVSRPLLAASVSIRSCRPGMGRPT